MTVTDSSLKGKKREYEGSRSGSSSLSPVPIEVPKAKRSRRAETRQCPVCYELIPLRLLAVHSVLESQRVELIISQVGSTECMFDALDDGPGPSSRSRRSALKALKSLGAMKPGNNNPTDVPQQADKIIQTIKRHRKRRHAKFRDMARMEDESNGRESRTKPTGAGITCPICFLTVRGDQDVLDAHVDACVANENRRVEEERQHTQNLDDHIWEGIDQPGGAGGYVGNVRGTGFHTRNSNEEDVEDELDVDGDEAFGEAQFTERDILHVDHPHLKVNEHVEIETEGDSEDEVHQEGKTLRDLVAEGKVAQNSALDVINTVKTRMEQVMGMGDAEKLELAILIARKRGDKSSLIIALEDKVKQLEAVCISSPTTSLCRICIDPYSEPTVSTGCWHTCCRECWLRCLGSTRLCPICKRITSATDLRRIYL